MSTKLAITEHTDTRIILAVNHAGKYWEIDIRVDTDEDGGIDADITRDGIICTSAGFGWHDKHDNDRKASADRAGFTARPFFRLNTAPGLLIREASRR